MSSKDFTGSQSNESSKSEEDLIKEFEKVLHFSKTMRIELENNSHKGSITEWKGISDKISELEYHKSKLIMAIKLEDTDAIREFIADCANILLSIGDEFNLYDNSPENDGKSSKMKDDLFDRIKLKNVKRTNWKN